MFVIDLRFENSNWIRVPNDREIRDIYGTILPMTFSIQGNHEKLRFSDIKSGEADLTKSGNKLM